MEQKRNNKNKSKNKQETVSAKKGIDFTTLGKRIRFVRERLLNLSQSELAEQLDSHQVMISRVEKGIGGSLELVLKIVDFLYSKNIAAKELFAQDFSEDAFLTVKENTETDYLRQLQNLIHDIKHSVTSDLDKLHSYTALLQYQFPVQENHPQ